MIHGHGGNIDAMARQLGCRPEDFVDMSSNINPLGMPPGLHAHLRDHLHRIGSLPEPDAGSARQHMAALLGVDARCLIAGGGTTHFIYTACPALGARKVLIVGPTYADYADACRMHHVPADYFLAGAGDGFAVDLAALDARIGAYDTAFICNPNNPTGHLIPHQGLRNLCAAHPETRFIIDESYLPFAGGGDSQSLVSHQPENAIVLWSLSKIFGIPGLRAGFLVAGRETVALFERFLQPWSVNALAQAAVAYLGSHPDTVRDFFAETRRFIAVERQKFHDGVVSRSSMVPFASQSSYLLMALPQGAAAQDVCRRMAQKRFLIRNCHNFYGLSDHYIRVALKDREANRRALDGLVGIVNQAPEVD